MGKYFHKNKTKMNISIRVAAVLLCLTLVSACLVSGLFARYATSGQSSDNARVAKFSVEGSGTFSQPIEANLVPGESKSADVIIENNSEVAVEYTITVTNVTNNLPLNLRMEKDGVSHDAQGNSITHTEQQLPGSHTDEYKLHIAWPKGDNDPAKMGMVDYITVTVTAAQTD